MSFPCNVCSVLFTQQLCCELNFVNPLRVKLTSYLLVYVLRVIRGKKAEDRLFYNLLNFVTLSTNDFPIINTFDSLTHAGN